MPNQEFLQFIEEQNGKNLETLLRLESTCPGIFITVMTNFEEVKARRKGLDAKGHTTVISWENAMIKAYSKKIYKGVTEENRDIAEELAKKGLEQELFDKVCELREEGKDNNVPRHILGKTIQEESVLDSIDGICRKTQEELLQGVQNLDYLYPKKFSYEWLDKTAVSNGIIGIYTDCCAMAINRCFKQGEKVVRATMTAHDVQNLVVRNSKGEIIGKGAVYVNKQYGYAVVNDFYVNKRYYKNGTIKEEDRKLILSAFQRGLQAFIDEYDRQNLNVPLQQINVGRSYERLKVQIEEIERTTKTLTVPEENGFGEGIDNQKYIIYKKGEIPIKEARITNDDDRTN